MAQRTVILDNGSGSVKCGFSGQHFPEQIIPSIIGRPKLRSSQQTSLQHSHDVFVSEACNSYRNMLDISYPMDNGVVRSWDDMQLIWDYAFGSEKLNIDPKDCRIVLTEPALNSAVNRQKMIEVLFEKYGFQSLLIGMQAVFAVVGNQQGSGICIDSGDGVTHICPVYEYKPLKHLCRRLDIAGRHITSELHNLLLKRGHHFNHSADFEVIRELKEKYCYVAVDPAIDDRLVVETTALNQSFTLPNGKKITVAEELYKAPEILFRPELLGQETPGISQLVFNTVMAADINIRKELFKNILVTGGTTEFHGFPERLNKEINELYLTQILKGDKTRFEGFKPVVHAPPKRKNLVFRGASFFAETLDERGPEAWITKEDYFDGGMTVCTNKLAVLGI